MDIRLKKYTINPLTMLGSVGGFSFADLLTYKPGVQSLVTSDTIAYYKELYDGVGDREFKLTSKAPVGVPISDRWISFINGTAEYYIECPVLKLNQTKIINKTQVYGYEGTIKEYVALSDWEIDFTFYIVGQKRMEIDNASLWLFLDMFKIKTEVSVNSPLLNNVYDIDKVVIESVNSITEHETYNNIMVVNLSLLSDKEYEPFTKKSK